MWQRSTVSFFLKMIWLIFSGMPNGETKDTIESTELTSAVTAERILGRSHTDPGQQYCLHYIYMFDLVHVACAPL